MFNSQMEIRELSQMSSVKPVENPCQGPAVDADTFMEDLYVLSSCDTLYTFLDYHCMEIADRWTKFQTLPNMFTSAELRKSA